MALLCKSREITRTLRFVEKLKNHQVIVQSKRNTALSGITRHANQNIRNQSIRKFQTRRALLEKQKNSTKTLSPEEAQMVGDMICRVKLVSKCIDILFVCLG